MNAMAGVAVRPGVADEFADCHGQHQRGNREQEKQPSGLVSPQVEQHLTLACRVAEDR